MNNITKSSLCNCNISRTPSVTQTILNVISVSFSVNNTQVLQPSLEFVSSCLSSVNSSRSNQEEDLSENPLGKEDGDTPESESRNVDLIDLRPSPYFESSQVILFAHSRPPVSPRSNGNIPKPSPTPPFPQPSEKLLAKEEEDTPQPASGSGVTSQELGSRENSLSQWASGLEEEIPLSPQQAFRLRLEQNQSITINELRQFGDGYRDEIEFALDFADSRISNQELQRIIERFPRITRIKASRYFTNDNLRCLSQLPNLTSLDLAGCSEITDAGLEHLRNLHNLISLDLSDCDKITDEGLKYLSLYKDENGNEWLVLTNLQSLNLAGCERITDWGLCYVSYLRDLVTLNLRGCVQISDQPWYLNRLRNLVRLDLTRCYKITRERINQLRTDLEGLEIVCPDDWNYSINYTPASIRAQSPRPMRIVDSFAELDNLNENG